MRLFSAEGDVAIKTPKQATCADFCASTIRTQPGNITRIARHANHFGFWILRPSSVQVSDFRLSKAESAIASKIFVSCSFSQSKTVPSLNSGRALSFTEGSQIENSKLLDDLIRPIQH
jgi:hypothetical protein